MLKKHALLVAAVVALVAVIVLANRGQFSGTQPDANARAANLPMAPDFTLQDLHGREVSLAQFRGKVVLINFWATWCSPCRIEIPWMIEFQKKYGEKGFVVLGIATDDEGKEVVEPYVRDERFDVDGEQMAINYTILLGNDGVAQKFGGLIGIPTSLVISREGRIVKRFIGLVNHDYLVKEIEGLL